MCDVQTTFSVPWSLDPRLTFSVGSVGLGQLLGPLQLDLESLGADLEAVHGLDGGHGAHGVVVGDEAWNGRKKKFIPSFFLREQNKHLGLRGNFGNPSLFLIGTGERKVSLPPSFFPIWL